MKQDLERYAKIYKEDKEWTYSTKLSNNLILHIHPPLTKSIYVLEVSVG
jgi:hypothetical protein